MESTVLSEALDKLKQLEPEEIPDLSEDEARALSNYLSETASAPTVSTAEQVLCRHIRAVLQARAHRAHHMGAPPAQSDFKRSNHALRAAIDLFLVGDFASVRDADLKLLRDTDGRLRAMAKENTPSQNQQRLGSLIAKCLDNYNAWVADNPAQPSKPVAPEPVLETIGNDTPVSAPPTDTSAMTTWDTKTLLAALSARESVHEIAGVPVTANLRLAEHTGDLVLEADCPDDVYLAVREGSLYVKGGVSGYVTADNDVDISGNSQGGWVYARRGGINVNRVLAGSTLIAPAGTIKAVALENPALLYCAGQCRVEENVMGGRIVAEDLLIAGTLRKSAVFSRGRIEAQTIEGSAGDGLSLVFRTAQSCHDYGCVFPESAVLGLRHSNRAHFRMVTTPTICEFINTEWLCLCRSWIYALRAEENPQAVLRELRTGHGIYAALRVVVELGESVKEAFAVGESLGEDYTTTLLSGALEECSASLNLVSKETTSMSREFVASVEPVEAAIRHVNSISKKLKEALRLGVGMDNLMRDVDMRLDEWRKTAEEARVQYGGALPAVKELLGESMFGVTDCEKLKALAVRMTEQVPESRTRGAELRTLKQKVSQYHALSEQWDQTAQSNEEDNKKTAADAFEATGLLIARRTNRGLRTEHMSAAIPIRTLALQERPRDEAGTTYLQSPEASPYHLRCEHLRLYREE